MAIHKAEKERKKLNISASGLGVSLSDVTKTTVKSEDNRTRQNDDEISSYAHDVRRSVLAGGAAIALELIIYFTHLIK